MGRKESNQTKEKYTYVSWDKVKNTPEGVLIADCHNRKHEGLVIIYLQVHGYWGVVEV